MLSAISAAFTPSPESGKVSLAGERPSCSVSNSDAYAGTIVTPSGAPAIPVAATASLTRTWEDEILYFVMVDRFANGDKTNDANADPSHPERFHGGDWQGVVDHLDDLQKLGVTTIWLSPAVENDNDFLGMQGYHGYWVMDFYRPDPHLGSMAKLKELVDKAHARGMKVILDVIVNHVGYNHPWVNDPKKHDWFHHEGDIDFVTESALENGNLRGLPDLAQENSDVSKYLIDNAKWWVQQTGVDGFRVDAVKHVPRPWLQKFADEMHAEFGDDFFMVGEAYSPSADRVAAYQKDGHLDSLFDFPTCNAVRSAIGYDEERGTMGVLSDALRQVREHPYEAWRLISEPHGDMRSLRKAARQDDAYARAAMLSTMVDNHDMDRFATIAGNDAREKLKLAMTFMLTSRGIPCIYQGTEDGMGLSGEGNRDDKKWGDDPALSDYIAARARLRHDSVALRRGAQVEVHADSDVYAFARVHPDEKMLVALNRTDEIQFRKMRVKPDSGLCDGDVLVDVFTEKKFEVRDGKLQVEIPPRGSLVLRLE